MNILTSFQIALLIGFLMAAGVLGIVVHIRWRGPRFTGGMPPPRRGPDHEFEVRSPDLERATPWERDRQLEVGTGLERVRHPDDPGPEPTTASSIEESARRSAEFAEMFRTRPTAELVEREQLLYGIAEAYALAAFQEPPEEISLEWLAIKTELAGREEDPAPGPGPQDH